jgi:hypothetical protein
MAIQQMLIGLGAAREKGWVFKNVMGASDSTNLIGGSYASACSVAIDGDENVYYAHVAQVITSGSNYSARMSYLTKLNKEGTFQWSKALRHQQPQFVNNSLPLHGPSITCDSSGDVYIVYTRKGHAVDYDSIYTEKRNSSGVRQWGKQTRIKSNNKNSVAVDIFVDGSNNLFIMGFQNNNNSSQGDIGRKVWIAQLNRMTGARLKATFCGRTYTGGNAQWNKNEYGLQSCGLAHDGTNLIVAYFSNDNGYNGSGGSSPSATLSSVQIQHFSHSGSSFGNLRSRYASYNGQNNGAHSYDTGILAVSSTGEVIHLSSMYRNINFGSGTYIIMDQFNGSDHGTQYAFRKNTLFGLNKTNNNNITPWYGSNCRGLKFDPEDDNILYMCAWGICDSSGRYGFSLLKLTRSSVSADWGIDKVMSVFTTFGEESLYWPSDDYSNRNAMEMKGDFLYVCSRPPTSGNANPRRAGMVFKIHKKLDDSGTYGDIILVQNNTNIFDINPGNLNTNRGGNSNMQMQTETPTFGDWNNLEAYNGSDDNGIPYTGATKTVTQTG